MRTTLPERPAPWGLPPDGYHFEAVEQGSEWITPAAGNGGCRFTVGPAHRQCKQPAVATLMRGYGPRKQPWNYCEKHLYGRWIEDGKVLGWRLVEDIAR